MHRIQDCWIEFKFVGFNPRLLDSIQDCWIEFKIVGLNPRLLDCIQKIVGFDLRLLDQIAELDIQWWISTPGFVDLDFGFQISRVNQLLDPQSCML